MYACTLMLARSYLKMNVAGVTVCKLGTWHYFLNTIFMAALG